MKALTKDDIDTIVFIIKNSSCGYYSLEEMEEAEFEANNIDGLESSAFDNSLILNILGELD